MGRLHDDALRTQSRARRPPCGLLAVPESPLTHHPHSAMHIVTRFRQCEEPTGPAFDGPDDKLRDEAIQLLKGYRLLRGPSSGAHSRDPLARHDVYHADWRVCQKFTTRCAVEGIRRAKFTRALSMSVGDGTRCAPSRSRIRARTVAHSRPTTLPTIRIGS